jgi:hypothetical protein
VVVGAVVKQVMLLFKKMKGSFFIFPTGKTKTPVNANYSAAF